MIVEGKALDEELEILVFTYNRAENLRNTLASLESGPFASCRLTILDNCSTDHTPEVCREFAARSDRVRVVTHSRNIGLGPNYLRAVELSRAQFSWILSDDEDFDFSACDDVIEAVEGGRFDLISLGSPGQYEWERGMRTTTRQLLAAGQRYFWVWTFASGVIFRTDMFDSRAVQEGYQHLHGDYAHFPHFEFLHQCLLGDVSVYVSARDVVRRSESFAPRTRGTPLSWLVELARPTLQIENPALRRTAVYEATDTRWQWYRQLAEALAFERLEHPERVAREVVELAITLTGEQRIVLLLIAPIAFLPRPLLRFVRRVAGRSPP